MYLVDGLWGETGAFVAVAQQVAVEDVEVVGPESSQRDAPERGNNVTFHRPTASHGVGACA
jgi:hypothetical protein